MRTGNRRWERQEMTRVSTPLAVAAEHYLMACLTEGKTPKTLRGYREKLSRFIRWLEGSVDELTVTMAREFVAALQAKKKWQDVPSVRQSGQRLSAQTVANHVRVMKAFSTWLYEEGFTVENVLARLALPKVPRKVIDILSQEEIARLVAAIDATSEMAARDRAVIVLFLDTGLRLSELVSLSLENVHMEEQWLKVMGKGQKERILPLGARTTQLLVRYIHQGRYDPLSRRELFLTANGEPISENTIKMLFGRLRKRSGIARLHPHLLRHTFATQYLIAGGDVFTLQHILGHTILEMTRRYVSIASTQVSIQHRRFSPMDQLALPVLSSSRRVEVPLTRPLQGSRRPKHPVRLPRGPR